MRQPVPFGKYLLLDRISVGGMAEVFKAKSYGVEGFEKIIAIKRILPTMGEDRDFIKMFIDEAKIAGQLAHANICQIFELGRIDGSHFIAMEFIWGKDLLQIQNRLRKLKQPMPIPMACFSIAKVLEGLDYAHRKRDPLGRPLEIVHRDCSPQNVLVSYEGEVKVIDFGIAKATSRNSRTMAGVLKGKFGYMSPEQVRGLPLDRRSDIFALGTMLFECLTGDRLFQGETDFSTLEKVRNVDIRRPREVNPAIPEQIERIIMKALAKDVEERYQWCSEMLADLQQFLMTQEQVFTAKTLSGWLKEAFAGDLEKERGLLEQYKRVGRDGLIAGLPAAEAKLDVVEHLGEAPQIAESDATQLGGPSFDDIEKELAAMASPESAAAKQRGKTQADGGDDRDGDFGEEAPTEIFGEVEHGKPPPPVAAPPARAPTSSPAKAPPKPPGAPSTGPVPRVPSVAPVAPPRAPTPPPIAVEAMAPQIQIGDGPPQALNALSGSQNQGRTLMGAVAPAGLPNYANGNYPGQRQTPQPQATPMPQMTSQSAMQQPQQHMQQQPQQMQQPPQMMFDPQTGYPLNPSGQYPSQQQPQQQNYGNYGGYGQQQQPQTPLPYASDPNMQAYGSQPQQQQPQQSSPYPTAQQGYGQSPYQSGAMPVPALAPPADAKKKSSLGRDIAIGVAIAIVVLGGFLAVKFLVLDGKSKGSDVATGGSGSGSAAATSGIATLKISLPGTGDMTAALFIDEKSIGNFGDKAEVLTNVGTRKVRLQQGDQKCEREMKLEPNKPNVFDCVMTAKAATPPPAGSGSAGSAAIQTAGSASGIAGTQAGSGSATAIVAVGTGSGSAATVAVKKPDDTTKKPDTTTTTQKKPDQVAVNTNTTTNTTTKKPDPKDKMPLEDNTKKTPPADGKGYLEIYSTPKAKILVDGADTGMSTPVTGKALSLSPGKHKITFIVGEDRFTFPATVKAGATEKMTKELN